MKDITGEIRETEELTDATAVAADEDTIDAMGNAAAAGRIALPDEVQLIISALQEHGFEAYTVGGCVRDSFLGRTPGDWDITTSAKPEEIKSIFRRTVDTGIEHGTVTVLLGDLSFEVTTYRVDGEYKDLRHPAAVSFTSSLAEDLRRRDFTINAMAYNMQTGLVDLFDGMGDLKRRVIRAVGKPDERFNEDALRILRAVRFAAQLDFAVEAGTEEAISRHAANLRAVSRERILTELSKLICSAHIERVEDIFRLGIAPYIAPHFEEISLAHLRAMKTAADAAENAMKSVAADAAENHAEPESGEVSIASKDAAFDVCQSTGIENRYIRFAMLTEGMSEKQVQSMLRGLKADNVTVKQGAFLAERAIKPLPTDRYLLKKEISRMPLPLFEDLLQLKRVSKETDLYREHCPEENIEELISIFREILDRGEPIYVHDLVLSGQDLVNSGVPEGPEVGQILNRMLDAVQKDPRINTVMYLISHYYKN